MREASKRRFEGVVFNSLAIQKREAKIRDNYT